MKQDRALAAFLLALIVAVLLWMISTWLLLAAFDGWSAAIHDVPSFVTGGVMFGLPVATFAIVLGAGSVYAVFTVYNAATFPATLTAGVFGGALTHFVIGQVLDVMLMFHRALGAVIGFGTGWAWWVSGGSSGKARRLMHQQEQP